MAEGEELAYHGERLGFVGALEVRDAAPRVVRVGAAELLVRHLLVRHRLDDVGAGDEHVARPLDHQDEVGDGGRVDGAAGARSHDRGDLRDDARGEGVA